MALDPTYWAFLSSGENEAQRTFRDALRLTMPFGIGTLLVIVPLGSIAAYPGKSAFVQKNVGKAALSSV